MNESIKQIDLKDRGKTRTPVQRTSFAQSHHTLKLAYHTKAAVPWAILKKNRHSLRVPVPSITKEKQSQNKKNIKKYN